MKFNFYAIFAFLILSVFLVGCTVEEGSVATSDSQNQNEQKIVESPIEKTNEAAELLDNAISAEVDTSGPENWDSDAMDDGVIVYPSLNDKNRNTVQFEGIELNVDIEIWDTIYNDDWDQVKNNQIYSGQGIIDSWKDGNFMYDGGIRVLFDDLEDTNSESDYGFILIKIHLPDGRVLEAQSDPSNDIGIRIK